MYGEVDIFVTGVPRGAMFYVDLGQVAPMHPASLHQIDTFYMPVELEFTYRAIRYIRDPKIKSIDRRPLHSLYASCKAGVTRNGCLNAATPPPIELFLLRAVNKSCDEKDITPSFPVLRLPSPETREIATSGLKIPPINYPKGIAEHRHKSARTVVYWQRGQENYPSPIPTGALATVQIGLQEEWDTAKLPQPSRPSGSRADVVIANIDEFSMAYRVRKSLSYEAIAVDLLHELRGDSEKPEDLLHTSVDSKKPEELCTAMEKVFSGKIQQDRAYALVVRISNAAVFVYYRLGRFESAHLLFHRNECAPLAQPELGQMHGHTGFVGPHVAVGVNDYLVKSSRWDSTEPSAESMRKVILQAVRRGLAWQHVCFHRGHWKMFYSGESVDDRQPLIYNGNLARANGCDRLFADIYKTLSVRYDPKSDRSGLTRFDSALDDQKSIVQVNVDILGAIAHRRQWFMAYSVVVPPNWETAGETPKPLDLEARFQERALKWLSSDPVEQPKDSDIPIAKIGDAWLTDRREVEDYLSLYQVLRVYEQSKESRPLNIAVFGAPGSGKSFAVKQLVKHTSGSRKDTFQEKALEFNLGEFKSIDDLSGALNQVRNRCLEPGLPIVFFDEFDSTFQGQAFGWLKYFLAPMQDGAFYDNGQNYRLGRAVFVFAGGVNRSFEELNGRLRNPGFCESKGPDFISRLKAHLNILGINKQDPETDQGRFVLRRGILLRAILMKRFEMKGPDATHKMILENVAKALLSVPNFKHGVRSLESIISMCTVRPGKPIGPSDLPSMEQLDMHVDAARFLTLLGSKNP